MPTDFPAGTKSSYSAFSAFSVLGKLLEKTDPKGRKFAQIAKEELFEPLAMTTAQFGDTENNPHRVPVTHTPKEKEGSHNIDFVEMFLNNQAKSGYVVPAANAFGTIFDLYKFAENLRLNLTERRIVSPAMMRYATQNHTGDKLNEIFKPECEKMNMDYLRANYGLHGGYVRDVGHFPCMAYLASPNAFGGIGVGSVFYLIDPERELTVAFLSAGFIEGLSHTLRISRINDLIISACE